MDWINFSLRYKLLYILHKCILIVSFVVIGTMLTGCVLPMQEAKKSIAFLDLVADLKPGISREKVHSLLGKPYKSNEALHMEIYRHDSEQQYLLMYPPWPYEENITSFILVLYDKNWSLKSAAGDSNALPNPAYYQILINLDGYTLAALSHIENLILIAPPVYNIQETTSLSSEDKCHLFINIPEDAIGSDHRVTMKSMYLDDEMALKLFRFWGTTPGYPMPIEKGITQENLYLKLEIAKGSHTLKLATKDTRIEGHIETSFQCHGNKNLIVNIDVKIAHHPESLFKYTPKGEIRIDDSWQETTEGRREVLLFNNELFNY